MMILHCMKFSQWENVKREIVFGKESVEKWGFVHCSSIENMWRVAPNFLDEKEDLVLLCIDTDKLISEVKWEDHDNCGRTYPHVYGEIEIDSVVQVLPFLKDKTGRFVLNPELE